MTTELTILAWGSVLALIHIFAAVQVKTRQYGTQWNMGPRDGEMPPPSPLAGRLTRAQANYLETFPVMAAAILIVTLASLETRWTGMGAILWLVCRAIYLPLYAFAVPFARSAVWIAGLIGILMVLWPALRAAL